jgi:hypothetical protein
MRTQAEEKEVTSTVASARSDLFARSFWADVMVAL